MMKRKNTIEERNAAPAATRTTTNRGRRAPKGVLRRLLKTLFEFYPVLLPVTTAPTTLQVVGEGGSYLLRRPDLLRDAAFDRWQPSEQ